MFDDLKHKEERIVSEPILGTESLELVPQHDAVDCAPYRREPDLSQLYNQGRGSEAIHALNSPISMDDFATGLFITGGLIIVWLLSKSIVTLKETFAPAGFSQPQYSEDIIGLTLAQVPNIGDVLWILPLALLGCIVMAIVSFRMARDSKTREIDWTDTHLFLEYSGPLTLAVKWTAIDVVDQISRWDIFSGRQPVFLVKTADGNQFRLKLSDISRKKNIGAFFSMVKTNATHAQLNVEPNLTSDNSYTELWLKYFSSPAAREKTGQLENGMFLDNGHYQVLGTVGGGGQGTAYLGTVCKGKTAVNAVSASASLSQSRTIEKVGEENADVLPSDSELAQGISLLKVGDGEGASQVQHILPADDTLVIEGSQVVLKEYVLPVHRGHLTAERTAEKLKAEAEILQHLDHPQIVKIEDAFIEDFRGYLVLEYVIGETLKSIVERLGPAGESEVIDWAVQVCRILGYLHGLTPSVVHRDITPDNLMLQRDGLLKLVDFNVAYQVDSSSTATVVGKHSYIPPEQFRGKPTVQSDIYALGGTMHFLLTGQEPEPISKSHPRRVNENVSQELDAIIAKATATTAAARYTSVAELEQALLALKQ